MAKSKKKYIHRPVKTYMNCKFEILAGLLPENAKISTVLTNLGIMVDILGPMKEDESRASAYEVLNTLECMVHTAFFKAHEFKEYEIVEVTPFQFAVFQFRGLYEEREGEYAAYYEYDTTSVVI